MLEENKPPAFNCHLLVEVTNEIDLIMDVVNLALKNSAGNKISVDFDAPSVYTLVFEDVQVGNTRVELEK